MPLQCAESGTLWIGCAVVHINPMDLLTKKTPDHKCRRFCCLIEFMDWRYSQSCWYFLTVLRTIAPLIDKISAQSLFVGKFFR